LRIGKGTYGTVYRATDATSGATVALKRITMHNEVDDGFPLTALREVSALRECSQHAGIVRLLGIAAGRSRKDIFLVFE
jgi:serine/threonine protein kinase